LESSSPQALEIARGTVLIKPIKGGSRESFLETTLLALIPRLLELCISIIRRGLIISLRLKLDREFLEIESLV
jgi:hypothetical protein